MTEQSDNSGNVCHFFRLPQELRDIIYEYAYADGPKCCITGRVVRIPGIEGVVPAAVLRYLSVDRQYLRESMVIFIRGVIISFGYPQHVTSINVLRRYWDIATLVNSCPNLVHVDIRIRPIYKTNRGNTNIIDKIRPIRGLQSFSVGLYTEDGKEYDSVGRMAWQTVEADLRKTVLGRK